MNQNPDISIKVTQIVNRDKAIITNSDPGYQFRINFHLCGETSKNAWHNRKIPKKSHGTPRSTLYQPRTTLRMKWNVKYTVGKAMSKPVTMDVTRKAK